jgi:hypothetical protein
MLASCRNRPYLRVGRLGIPECQVEFLELYFASSSLIGSISHVTEHVGGGQVKYQDI